MKQLSSTRPRRTVSLYGLAKVGKTTLAFSYPLQPEKRIAYICPDPGGIGLDSCPSDVRPLVDIFVPDGNRDPVEPGKMDWRREGYEMAQRDYGSENYGLIIVDHMTIWAEEWLKESARKNWFSDKGPVTGTNNPTVDADKKYAVPQPGDYNVGQQICIGVTDYFLRFQDIPVIIIFQEGYDSKRDIFGPQTVGDKGPGHMANRFGSTLWLRQEVSKENPSGDLEIVLRPTEKHICGVGAPNPMLVPAIKRIKQTDPTGALDFWNWLLSVKDS